MSVQSACEDPLLAASRRALHEASPEMSYDPTVRFWLHGDGDGQGGVTALLLLIREWRKA
jgi:hypothetical protein